MGSAEGNGPAVTQPSLRTVSTKRVKKPYHVLLCVSLPVKLPVCPTATPGCSPVVRLCTSISAVISGHLSPDSQTCCQTLQRNPFATRLLGCRCTVLRHQTPDSCHHHQRHLTGIKSVGVPRNRELQKLSGEAPLCPRTGLKARLSGEADPIKPDLLARAKI